MGNSGLWEDRRPTYHDWTSKKILEYLHGFQQHFKGSHTVVVIKTDELPRSLTHYLVFFTKLGYNEIFVKWLFLKFWYSTKTVCIIFMLGREKAQPLK